MVIAAIFIILFVVILSILQAVSMFGRISQVVLALCVSLLCIIGLLQSFFLLPGHSVIPNATSSEITIEPAKEIPEKNYERRIYIFPLLLPFEALAVILLLLPLALLFAAFGKGRRWQQIVRTYRKLSAANSDIEQGKLQTFNTNRLSRKPENGKAKVKSTSKDIHM